MARKTPTISWTSAGEEHAPKMNVRPVQWVQLETQLGKKIPEPARSELMEICNWYLAQATLKAQARPLSAVTDIVDQITNAVSRLRKKVPGLLEYSGLDSTKPELGKIKPDDAVWDFYHRLFPYMEKSSIRISRSDIETAKPMPREIADWFDANRVSITLKDSVLKQSVDRVTTALASIKRGIIENPEMMHEPQFKVGGPFREFLIHCHSWAEKYDLPHSVITNHGSALPFSKMLHALHSMMPDHLGAPDLSISADAFADRIKAAKASWGK